MASKRLMATTVYGAASNYEKFTIPRMREYCQSNNLGFHLNRQGNCHMSVWEPALETAVQGKFNELCVIDADIAIAKDAPDIFEENKEGEWVAVRPANYHAHRWTQWIKEHVDPNFVQNEYFNSGTVIIRGEAINWMLEEVRKVKYKDGIKTDQEYINPLVYKLGLNTKSLPVAWNMMLRETDSNLTRIADRSVYFYHAIGGTWDMEAEKKVAFLKDITQKLRRAGR